MLEGSYKLRLNYDMPGNSLHYGVVFDKFVIDDVVLK